MSPGVSNSTALLSLNTIFWSDPEVRLLLLLLLYQLSIPNSIYLTISSTNIPIISSTAKIPSLAIKLRIDLGYPE
jgi:hypothetical protein